MITVHCGCTADVVLITDTEIICANAGDSRCVLAILEPGEGDEDDKYLAMDMSRDHKPDMQSEEDRIKRAGGFVKNNRVDDELNLGRSLGDLMYKLDPKRPQEEQKVVPTPEIKKMKISAKTPFVIIGCDGIWDCIDSQKCVEFFNERIDEDTGPYSELVGELMD